jgi:phage terminase large subunit
MSFNHSLMGLPPKQALLLALAEKARREEYRRSKMPPRAPEIDPDASSLVLLPGHPFNDLLKPARYKIYWGGRGSAKSWAVAEYLVREAKVRPIRILCTREFQSSIKESVHKLLKDTIERLGLTAWFAITDKSIKSLAGAEFIFKGLHHDPGGVKSTEAVDKCWVEEGQTTSADSWKFLIPTIRKPGSEIIVTFNPEAETDPTYVRFIEQQPPRMICHKVNYDQNPYFPEELRAEMEWHKATDYEGYEHVWLGLPSKLSEAVIFAGKYRVEDFDDDLWEKNGCTLYHGLDHGFAKDPYALTQSFIYKRKLYIAREAFGVGVEFAGKMAPALPGYEKYGERGELEQLLDTVPGTRKYEIKADNSRPETISFLCGKGFRVRPADKWKGCVEDGIAHLKGFEEIIIHTRCKHMAQEARLYKFKVDKLTGVILPEVVDANNHGWDSVRYALDGFIKRRGSLEMWARLGAQQ